jgi:hypothetical protein
MKRLKSIPPPQVVRGWLSENIREGRVLRDLLKLSVRAAEATSSALASHRAQSGQDQHPEASGGRPQ